MGLYQQAIKVVRGVYGHQHPMVVTLMNNIGIALAEQGKHALARPMKEQALRLARKIYGPDHHECVTSQTAVYAEQLWTQPVVGLSSQGGHHVRQPGRNVCRNR